ncbi:MAG: DUF2493 domain-containing protein [Patescibacteria group bacterium]|nr:DUF2493 domain-containing protein [Patescibacteria group bacterium]
MNVAIVGSRDGIPEQLVQEKMDQFLEQNQIARVVSGGARGVDTYGERWAKARGIPVQIFYPDWNKFGRSAGFKRNADIVAAADIVIAFTTGSAGTANTIKLAREAGKKVIVWLC